MHGVSMSNLKFYMVRLSKNKSSRAQKNITFIFYFSDTIVGIHTKLQEHASLGFSMSKPNALLTGNI